MDYSPEPAPAPAARPRDARFDLSHLASASPSPSKAEAVRLPPMQEPDDSMAVDETPDTAGDSSRTAPKRRLKIKSRPSRPRKSVVEMPGWDSDLSAEENRPHWQPEMVVYAAELQDRYRCIESAYESEQKAKQAEVGLRLSRAYAMRHAAVMRRVEARERQELKQRQARQKSRREAQRKQAREREIEAELLGSVGDTKGAAAASAAAAKGKGKAAGAAAPGKGAKGKGTPAASAAKSKGKGRASATAEDLLAAELLGEDEASMAESEGRGKSKSALDANKLRKRKIEELLNETGDSDVFEEEESDVSIDVVPAPHLLITLLSGRDFACQLASWQRARGHGGGRHSHRCAARADAGRCAPQGLAADLAARCAEGEQVLAEIASLRC